MSLIGIVAIDRKMAIGKDGKLPWHFSEDLKFFKRKTIGNTIVMGFNTWESIGKPLPKRLSVVMSSRRQVSSLPGVVTVRSVPEVKELSKFLKGDVFVIGGAATYSSFADELDGWIVTEIPLEIEDADVSMSNNFLEGFELEKKESISDELVVKYFMRGNSK